MLETTLPDWLEEHLVGEEAFAVAYAQVPDWQRAWLKTGIARHFEWHARPADSREVLDRTMTSGLRVCRSREPMPWCLIRATAADRSPPRLLAAVMPALMAEPGSLAVIGSSEPPAWLPEQLLALELAGVESVYALGPEESLRLVRDLERAHPGGALIDLGAPPSGAGLEEPCQGRPPCWRLPIPRIGVWSEGDSVWDLEALRFSAAGAELQLWSPASPAEASGTSSRCGAWEEFLGQGFDTLFVPTDRLDGVLSRADRVFGPGQEGCWVWPELSREALCRERVAWALG